MRRESHQTDQCSSQQPDLLHATELEFNWREFKRKRPDPASDNLLQNAEV